MFLQLRYTVTKEMLFSIVELGLRIFVYTKLILETMLLLSAVSLALANGSVSMELFAY